MSGESHVSDITMASGLWSLMKTERDAFLLTMLWQFRIAKFRVETELPFKLSSLLLGEVSAGVYTGLEFKMSKILRKNIQMCEEVLFNPLHNLATFYLVLVSYIGLTQNAVLYLLPILFRCLGGSKKAVTVSHSINFDLQRGMRLELKYSDCTQSPWE